MAHMAKGKDIYIALPPAGNLMKDGVLRLEDPKAPNGRRIIDPTAVTRFNERLPWEKPLPASLRHHLTGILGGYAEHIRPIEDSGFIAAVKQARRA